MGNWKGSKNKHSSTAGLKCAVRDLNKSTYSLENRIANIEQDTSKTNKRLKEFGYLSLGAFIMGGGILATELLLQKKEGDTAERSAYVQACKLYIYRRLAFAGVLFWFVAVY